MSSTKEPVKYGVLKSQSQTSKRNKSPQQQQLSTNIDEAVQELQQASLKGTRPPKKKHPKITQHSCNK